MFTGLVEGMGTVVSLNQGRLVVQSSFFLTGLKRGASLAINGCCLSAVRVTGKRFAADLSPETLRLTTLGTLRAGDKVNLERPVRPTQFLGGHIVQGHIDGMGKVLKIVSRGPCKEFYITMPRRLARYCVAKGSIAVAGVSLTINRIWGIRRKGRGARLTIMIIPETLKKTCFGALEVGSPINLEVDLIAKYVKKLIG